MLTVGELLSYLEDMDPDTEIRLASQPAWPFQYSVAGLVSSEDLRGNDEDEDNSRLPPNVVYLVEGRQLDYASKQIWDMV